MSASAAVDGRPGQHGRILVLSDNPISRAIETIATAVGREVRIEAGDDGGPGLEPGPRDAVVLCDHDAPDAPAVLRAALASEASYVAMMASRSRAAALVAELMAEGVDTSTLHVPAGHDLGGKGPGRDRPVGGRRDRGGVLRPARWADARLRLVVDASGHGRAAPSRSPPGPAAHSPATCGRRRASAARRPRSGGRSTARSPRRRSRPGRAPPAVDVAHERLEHAAEGLDAVAEAGRRRDPTQRLAQVPRPPARSCGSARPCPRHLLVAHLPDRWQRGEAPAEDPRQRHRQHGVVRRPTDTGMLRLAGRSGAVPCAQ